MQLFSTNTNKSELKVSFNKNINNNTNQQSSNVKWLNILHEQIISYKKPIGHGDKVVDFSSMLPAKFPDLGIYILRKGFIVGDNAWTVTKDGVLLTDTTWYGKNIREFSTNNLSYNIVKYKGKCLNISSDWSNVNYGHFLLDGICKLELFLLLNINLNNIDFFYCSTKKPYNRSILKQLGIPLKKCIEPQKNIAFQFTELYAPSFPGIRRIYPKWSVDFLKRKFNISDKKSFRKIYIPRTTTRKIINEASLIKIMKEFDFEIYYPENNKNSQQYFSESKLIISAHSSALADIAFCQPYSKILELIPSDHVFPYWYSLSNANDLEYHYIIGESLSNGQTTTYGPSPYDFIIDEELFRNTLLELCRKS